MDVSTGNGGNNTFLMDETPEEKKSVRHSASTIIHDKLSEGSVEQLDEWNVATALMSIDENHPAHPHHWPAWKKWFAAIIYTLLEVYIIWSSTAVINFTSFFQNEWHCSSQASNLVQSLFILGNACGPMVLGPMSDILGRKWVYVISLLFYIIFQIPQALAYNLPMMVINSAIAGICGSAAVANVASSMCDVFTKETVGLGMALFVWGANAGASIGSPIGEAFAEKNWRWFYWMNMIVGGVLVILCIFIPETLPASNVMQYAKKMEQTNLQISTLEKAKSAVARAKFAFTMAARIFITEPIILALGLYNGFAYGINFLYLDGLFPVFKNNYNMSYMHANETFLNFLVGVTIVVMMQPIQDWLYRRDKKRNGGVDRPEARFLISLVTVWFFPLGLFWFAFTSSGNISWVSPLIAGGVIAVGDPQLWLAMLNYVTDSYPSVAGSAVAAFTLPSFTLAAVLVHLGAIMFENMTTTWAMATLGFISLSLVLLIYIIYFLVISFASIVVSLSRKKLWQRKMQIMLKFNVFL